MAVLISFLFALSPAFSAPQTIADPYTFVWTDFEGSVQGLTRFFVEINGDKTPELFVGAKALIGNGGGEFHVFSKKDKGYKYLGPVFVSPDSIQVLSNKSNGFNDIKAYTNLSAFDGELMTYSYDGSAFKKRESRKIKSEEFSKNIKPATVKTEDSGPMLSWRP